MINFKKQQINKNLTTRALKLKLSKPLTFSIVRDCYATPLNSVGVPKDIISECGAKPTQ